MKGNYIGFLGPKCANQRGRVALASETWSVSITLCMLSNVGGLSQSPIPPSRVFRGKYFPNSSFLQARQGSRAS